MRARVRVAIRPAPGTPAWSGDRRVSRRHCPRLSSRRAARGVPLPARPSSCWRRSTMSGIGSTAELVVLELVPAGRHGRAVGPEPPARRSFRARTLRRCLLIRAPASRLLACGGFVALVLLLPPPWRGAWQPLRSPWRAVAAASASSLARSASLLGTLLLVLGSLLGRDLLLGLAPARFLAGSGFVALALLGLFLRHAASRPRPRCLAATFSSASRRRRFLAGSGFVGASPPARLPRLARALRGFRLGLGALLLLAPATFLLLRLLLRGGLLEPARRASPRGR